MGHQHFLLVTRASDEANPCSTPSLLEHVVVPPLLRSRHPLSESPQSIAWHRIKTNWVCQNRIKNNCSPFPQNTPSLLQKQVLSCLLCLQSVTVARPGRQNSQLPIQEAAGRAVSPEDSSKNPTGAISKETQRRLVSVTEGKILQPCLRSCSRSSSSPLCNAENCFMLRSQKVKIPGGLRWAPCHAAEQEHMALGFTTQPARTEVVENKTFHPPTWFCDFGRFRHRPEMFWFCWVKQRTRSLASLRPGPCMA